MANTMTKKHERIVARFRRLIEKGKSIVEATDIVMNEFNYSSPASIYNIRRKFGDIKAKQ